MSNKNVNIPPIVFAGRIFNSRHFSGTGKFSLTSIMEQAIKAYRIKMTRAQLIRVGPDNPSNYLFNTITQNNNIQWSLEIIC